MSHTSLIDSIRSVRFPMVSTRVHFRCGTLLIHVFLSQKKQILQQAETRSHTDSRVYTLHRESSTDKKRDGWTFNRQKPIIRVPVNWAVNNIVTSDDRRTARLTIDSLQRFTNSELV